MRLHRTYSLVAVIHSLVDDDTSETNDWDGNFWAGETGNHNIVGAGGASDDNTLNEEIGTIVKFTVNGFGSPIAGASVTILGDTKITGADGTVSFNLVKNLSFSAEISATGYDDVTVAFTATTATYNIATYMVGAVATKIIVVNATGVPIVNATVTVLLNGVEVVKRYD